MRFAIALFGITACMYGAGPTIGYGVKRGWYGGVEVNAGASALLQGVVGAQGDRIGGRFYTYALTGGEHVDDYNATMTGGFWLGGGLIYDHALHGMFDAAGDFGQEYPATNNGACQTDGATVLSAQLQLRYADEWELALAPKLERYLPLCID